MQCFVKPVKDLGYPPESSGMPLRNFKLGGLMVWFRPDQGGCNVEDRLEGAIGRMRTPDRWSL